MRIRFVGYYPLVKVILYIIVYPLEIILIATSRPRLSSANRQKLYFRIVMINIFDACIVVLLRNAVFYGACFGPLHKRASFSAEKQKRTRKISAFQ